MRTLFIIFSFISIMPIYGQNNISGIFNDELGNQLEIKGEVLKLTTPDSPGVPGKLLAECNVKRIDSEFIELNSVSPYITVNKELKITQQNISSLIDSLNVSFLIPYNKTNLEISILTNTFKNYNLDYDCNRNSIMLPLDTKTILFSISPGKYLTPHNPEGLYYGILFYSSTEHQITEGMNHVIIKLTAIDNSFFDKYYIKGDYARIIKGGIIWKDVEYRKVK
ncbi:MULTISPECIES: hypothetical protein [Dysgonomonas]|uniref:Uncharacterized protein n=1 Tax=Dysgonomonas gadei ATCC BAA-286 TaxID=742766 RepID=F5J3D2_9BACT|nr:MULTISPECIES: hypothetical protein [Dysgonomonas]EGJ99790.1 hypothetical protein HMPREF9455_03849 [Dysgonomonas gadei ATCC BAA-286]MBF0648118.1 hypothetical protein [Dysgonomonas sp. GY75]